MQLPLPHHAVLTGLACLTWQVGGSMNGVGELGGSGSSGGGRRRTAADRRSEWVLHSAVHPPHVSCSPPAAAQAAVIALGGCMLYVLRGRISGRSVLPASASGPSFATPKSL
mgnify:CR=1 FL=1